MPSRASTRGDSEITAMTWRSSTSDQHAAASAARQRQSKLCSPAWRTQGPNQGAGCREGRQCRRDPATFEAIVLPDIAPASSASSWDSAHIANTPACVCTSISLMSAKLHTPRHCQLQAQSSNQAAPPGSHPPPTRTSRRILLSLPPTAAVTQPATA